MLNHLKSEANIAYTENGAVTNASTMSDCLDLFAAIGALRAADDQEIIRRFVRAYAEDADIAMKILFFGRDVRGGLGERRVFRVIINWLAENRAESLRKNIELIQQITGFSSSAIVRWISTGVLKAFQPGKQYTVPKDFMLDFLISPYYRRIRRKPPLQKELMDTFERLWQEKGGE